MSLLLYANDKTFLFRCISAFVNLLFHPWVIGIKRIEKITNEEIKARPGVANISENIREARLRWLGHVERKTEEDAVMRTWQMEVSGHQKIGRPKLRWSDVMRQIHEGETSKDRRSTRTENNEIETSMGRPQIGKGDL